MIPAIKTRSRILFSATAAVVLGLQVAPWPLSLPAQENENGPTIVQVEAESSEQLSKREQKKLQKTQRSGPPEQSHQQAPPPSPDQLQLLQQQLQLMQQQLQQMQPQQMQPQQLQPQQLQPQQMQMQQQLMQQQLLQQQQQQQWLMQQRQMQQQPVQPQPSLPQIPPTDVQLELKKLYEKNGQAVPEMVDPKFSQPASKPGNTTAQSALPPGQNQAQANLPAAPVSAPKKKGIFGKFFGGKDDGPIQPPVEPPYTPPTATTPVTPPALFSAQPVEQPLPGNGLPNYSQLFNPLNVAGTPQNPHPGLIPPPVAAAPANDGFEAPLFVETPAENGANGLPAIDFSTPIVEPDTVELGQVAPLPLATPAEPADPFSDDALFPGTSEPATTAPAAVPNSSVAEASEPVESIPPAQEEVPVEENPYSGLTLEADPFSNPIAIQDEPTAPTAPREFPIEEPAFAEETVETDPPALMTPPDQDAPARIEEQPEQRVALSTPDANIEETPVVQDEATSLPPTRLIQTPAPGNERTRAKQEMIAARKGLRGLKGFCPVILRDDRDLADAHSQFRVIFNSKTYYLSSSEAVTAFHSDPAKYAPAARGCDVIQLAISGEELEGSLDYAVWYKGRLYMFTSAETMDTFVSSPSSHATLD